MIYKKIQKPPEKDITALLDFYAKNGFDLLPIKVNGKIPIEKAWTTLVHKDPAEWNSWLKLKLNIGVKTGKCSNITVIDLDTKIIPEFLQSYVTTTLLQETLNGWHFYFKYTKDLPKTRINDLLIDIENDNGQVVLDPSIVEDNSRSLILRDIIEMPADLKKILLEKITSWKSTIKDKEDFEIPNCQNFGLIKEKEGRNNFLISIGGVFRSKFNMGETELILDVLNQYVCDPPLARSEMDSTIMRSLERYSMSDEQMIAQKILEYLKMVPDQEASCKDIQEALQLKKKVVDKALNSLIRKQYIIKKRRLYHVLQRADWKEEFMQMGIEINFQMPYFHDLATFRWSDLLIFGSGSGYGKTHWAMNIIKRLIEQKIKPHYITLEASSRWALIAKQLGLVEGDFKWDSHSNPEHIEIEKNAVTIIDWLLPKDYAETDKLFEYFNKQLQKNGGILIIFVQLRHNGEFYAKDMIDFFPSFVCKFLYDNKEDTTRGYFEPTKIREAKQPKWHKKIPTYYDWDTKILHRVDELETPPPEEQKS